MSKELKFVDKTILSTPDPIHSSSMTATSKLRKSLDLNDIPERDSIQGRESSIGIMSFTSDDYRLSDAALHRQKERHKALSSLKKCDKRHSNFTSIPSQYLKKSDVSETLSAALFDSTINESDLLPGNSSTPRGSLFPEEFVMRQRQSLGARLNSFAHSLKSPGGNFEQIMGEIHKTMELGESCFQSGAEALAKLEEDEISWKRQRDIPAEIEDFSVSSAEEKVSMGNFFKQRSDDLIRVLPKSPKKSQPPIPLIEASVCSQDSKINLKDDSLDISEIQNILQSEDTKNHVDDESLGITDIQNILQSDESANLVLDKLLKNKPIENAANPCQKEPVDHRDKCTPIKDSDKSRGGFDEATKENISPDFNQEKSTLSSRSASSLSSLPNGKLPIATTKTEIVWGCVKPGRSSSQDFIIRNRSSNRVGIQCSVSNPSYRLNKEGSDVNFSGIVRVVLHPYELRTLTVTFSPTTLGGAVDNLNFTSMDSTHKQTVKQFIRLYGYGGYGNVAIQKIVKDITGKFLLCLGNLDEQQEMKQSFVIKNNGSLAAFTYFYFTSHGLHSFSNISIYPKTAVLLPEEEKEIVVRYTLPKADFNYIKSNKANNSVIDVGKLQVIHGTEVDRARLRKMCVKAKEKGLNVKPDILDMVEKFPGEVVPNDLKLFRESALSIDEILRSLNNEEIIVTLQQDIDQTISIQLEDESTMFQSLCQNTMFENTICKESCQIEPTRIILTPPDKIKDRILLTNTNKKTLYFEVSSVPEGLHFRPKDGTINPNETLVVDLQYTKKCDKTGYKVRILIDHDSFEVDVKVVFVGKP